MKQYLKFNFVFIFLDVENIWLCGIASDRSQCDVQ